MRQKKYLISYNVNLNGKTGYGSGAVTIKFGSWKKYFRGYSEKDMHKTRKVFADSCRQKFNLGTNKRVSIVLLNIVKLPVK